MTTVLSSVRLPDPNEQQQATPMRTAARARRRALLMKATFHIVAAALILCSGCSRTGDAKNLRRDDIDAATRAAYVQPIVLLEGTALPDNAALRSPSELARIGGFVVIVDRRADSLFHLVNFESGALVRSFGGRQSQGGMFSSPTSVWPAGHGGIWVLDPGLKRLVRVYIAERGGHVDIQLSDNVDLPGFNTFDARVLRDTEVYGTGQYEAGRVAHFSTRGEIIRYIGEVPGQKDTLPSYVRQQAYEVVLVADENRPRMAMLGRYSDRVEFFDGERLSEPTGTRPFGFDPVVVAHQRGDYMNFYEDPSLRFGYINATASGDRILALFSGRVLSSAKGAVSFGRFINVLDWGGKLIKVFEVDRDLAGIAVGADGRTIFGISPKRPHLVRYTLPMDVALRSAAGRAERIVLDRASNASLWPSSFAEVSGSHSSCCP